MTARRRRLRNLAADEAAATAIEYALLAALIAGAILLAAESLGTTVAGAFSKTNTDLITYMPATGP